MKQEVTSEVWTAVSSLLQLSLDSIVLINRQSAAEIHTELHLEAEDGSNHSGPHTPGSCVKSFTLTFQLPTTIQSRKSTFSGLGQPLF